MSNNRFTVLAVMLLAGIAASVFFGRLGHPFASTAFRPLELPLSEFPLEFGEWRGEDDPLSEKVYEVAGMDHALNRIYKNEAGESVLLYVAYYGNRQRGLRTIYHNPTVCLKGAGWRLLNQAKEKVAGGGAAPEEFTVTVYGFERMGRLAQIVNFCIIDDEVKDGPPREQPFELAFQKLSLSFDPGYYVTVQVVPLAGGKPEESRQRALRFLEQAAPGLFRHF